MIEGALPGRTLLGVGARLLTRPRLWTTAARQATILTTPAWRAFRLETQYGSSGHTPVPRDVMAWLAWCRSWRQTVPLPGGRGISTARRRVRG